jgi:hypothetical protein
VHLATVRRADRDGEFLGRGVLDEIAGRACLERRLHAGLIDERGDRDHLDARQVGAELTGRGHAVHRFHRQVHEHNVGRVARGGHRPEHGERLPAVRRLSHHDDVGKDGQVGTDTATHHPMVIHDENPDRGVRFRALTVLQVAPHKRDHKPCGPPKARDRYG